MSYVQQRKTLHVNDLPNFISANLSNTFIFNSFKLLNYIIKFSKNQKLIAMFARQQEKADATYEAFGSGKISDQLRVNFVRKVFSITAVQLIITTIFTYFSVYNNSFFRFQAVHTGLSGLAAFVLIATSLALGFSQTLSRKVPTNYVLLGLFTLSESYLVSFIAGQYDPELVLMALFLTATVVTSLAIYALSTKTEVTYFGGLIGLISIGLFAGFFLSWFIRLHFLHCLMFAGSCVISGLYLIYDIKLIMGKDALKLTLDDYIKGAMHLYIDIIRIFLKILELLAAMNDDKKNDKKNKRN